MRSIILLCVLSMISGIGAAAGAPDRKDREILPSKSQTATLFTKLTREKALSILAAISQLIRDQYVEKVDEKKILEGAISGMLSALDPHSSYFNAENYAELCVHTKGEFGGIGIEVTATDGVLRVVAPIDDTPAEKAGIQSGDTIVAVDGVPVFGMSYIDAVKKMRGAPGSSVKLMIKREGKDPFVKVLVRALIRVKSVKWRMEGNDVGYIRLSVFDENTAKLLKEAIESLQKKKIKGFVIDLRNNPGGNLDQAIFASNFFVPKGVIVSTRGRRPEEGLVHEAKPYQTLVKDTPVVVLINGGSASASEIMAGALQDHKVAIVVGERSFGKGSVQAVIPLSDGKDGGIKITISRYYLPSGRSIQTEGIVPDIEVKQMKNLAESEEVIKIREKNLPGVLGQKQGQEKKEEKSGEDLGVPGRGSEKLSIPDDLKPKETKVDDYQLLRAVDFVRVMALSKEKRKMNTMETISKPRIDKKP